jgi:glyoxylase-like metal-dependent hydrolase (beta-lactamase superfamily II)
VALTFPFPGPPGPGEAIEILPGLHWLRFPLPLKLDHVNLWLLEDDDGLTVIDTGLADETTRGLWEGFLRTWRPPAHAGASEASAPVRRILVTHHHPDHCGLGDWVADRCGAAVVMSSAAHEAGLVLRDRQKGTDMRSTAARLAGHGLSAEAGAFLVDHAADLESLRPGLPAEFIPLADGDTVATGRYTWRVIFGQGHAPDHVCLYCADPAAARSGGAASGAASGAGAAASASAGGAGVLISGDMVLPHISTHVGSPATWLPGNPVALFHESLRRLAQLPADTLVLPGHGLPFIGLRERVAELERHHEERCRTIAGALDEPRSAAELLQVVFQRELDPLQLMLAMNEAVAHLEYMTDRGELERLAGDDGVTRYVQKDRRGRGT